MCVILFPACTFSAVLIIFIIFDRNQGYWNSKSSHPDLPQIPKLFSLQHTVSLDLTWMIRLDKSQSSAYDGIS